MVDLKNKSVEDEEKTLASLQHALDMVRRETGFGEIKIVIRDNKVVDIEVTHHIRPKYINSS